MLGTALATSAFFGGYRGYVRRALADCAPAGSTYTCSGATTTTQALSGTPLVVTTTPGFSIDTTGSGGNAFTLTGTDGLAFTELYISSITGAASGIEANNSGTGALEITATGAVTGENIRGIYARNDGTDLTIKAAAVSGGNSGIFARNDGGGVLSITTTGKVSGGNFNGIFAKNNGTDLTIEAVDVSGGSYGINAQNAGSGVLSITATGNVTGGSASDGIYAKNKGTDLAINVATVSSGGSGIVVHDNGSGALSITATGTVTGANGDGILVSASKDVAAVTIDTAAVSGQLSGIWGLNLGGGPLSITATGTVTGGTLSGIFAASDGNGVTIRATDVSGGTDGINAQNNGSGALSIIATGKVSGTNYDGILAKNKGTDLTINANDVSGGTYGINAQNDGSGVLSITATGNVTSGSTSDGIYARNEGTNLEISVATVSSEAFGIYAQNNGSGALSIKATGTVTGASNYDGIFALNAGNDGLTITAAGVSGGTRGIDAQNNGSGALSITAIGKVTGGYYDGIFAKNQGTDLTINATDISGGSYGIFAHNYGSGAVSITATGAVTGTAADGIHAENDGNGGLTISTAGVSGGSTGILALNHGSGALSIGATGKVSGGNYNGIYARNYGTDLTIKAVDVSGGSYGINAHNDGSGALSITATGVVTGDADGIYARNEGTNLKINVATVTGGGAGIYARNYGSGALSINASGTVSGTSAEGIYARNYGSGDLTINASDVSGEYGGIYASNDSSNYSSSGSLLITATGKVSGTNADGIQAINSNYSGNVKVSANDVSGGTYGIRVLNKYGRGSLSITATGTVSGASADGISARNVSGIDLTISANDVSGGRNGIYAIDGRGVVTINAAAVSGGTNGIFAKSSYGTISITTTGSVEGQSGAGIYAYTKPGFSSSMTISTADVSGGGDGIHALNYGIFYGHLSITATGTVTGGTGDGISAVNLAGGMTISTADVSGGRDGISAQNLLGGDLVINTAAVSGGDNGIVAYNAAFAGGPGALSITATGKVTGDRYDGINASNYGSGSLTIDVVDVSGNIDGIHALNKKGGALSIAASGTVEGKTGAGISASNEFGTTNLTIEAAEVSGGTEGIFARNIGTGAVSITATGKVSGGTGHDGIFVRNNGNGATIKTEAVSGGANGINVDNLGIGAVFITTTGTVTGKGASGIYARSNASNAVLTISTAAVSGAQRGINVKSFGNGLASITATGTVTGHGAEGIYVFKYSRGDLKIDTVDVSGATDGIHILNGTGGAISITTRGALEGAAGAGIFAQNKAMAADSTTTVTVKSGSLVSGHASGVETRSTTGRAATVVNAGAITGTTGVLANGGPMTVFNTGIITGTGGTAIDLTAAGHPSTVNQQGGAITGKILLSAASDTVNVTGGAIAGNIVGQGNANLDFALGSGTFTFAAPYAVTGMEGVFMNSGTVTIAGTVDTDALTVNGGTMTVDGKINILAGLATVNGGKLVVGDDTHATASLVGGVLVNNGGTLGGIGTVGTTTIMAGGIHAPGNSPGTQTIDGDYTNHGMLKIDATPLQADQVVVNGTVDISGATLSFLISPALTADWNILNGPFTIIANDGGDAVAGTFSSVTKNLLFLDPSVDYVGGDGNDVTLELIRNDVKFADVARTPDQKATGNGVDSLGWGNPVWNAIALQSDETATRTAFDSLSGEIHASAKGALIEDSHFLRDAVNERIRSAFDGVGAPSVPVLAYGETGADHGATAAIGKALAPANTASPAAWGSVFGSWGSTDGDGNAARLDRSVGGFFTGIDGLVAEDVRLGIMTGYSHLSLDVDGRSSSGESDNYHIGVYGGTQIDALGLRAGTAYTWHDISTNRSVVFPGFADSLTADYDAATFQAFGEAGYRIDRAAVSFEPFANLAYVNLHTDGFTEKGGAAALTSIGQTVDTTFTTLGVRASTAVDLRGMKATARGMIGWRHAFGDTIPLATQTFAGGSPFTVAGVPIARDTALAEAGFDLNLTGAAALGVSYQGQFGSGATQNGFNARLDVRF